MRVYSSFLVRCWITEDESQGEQSVLQIEHIQTGASVRAATLTEVEPWILAACRNARAVEVSKEAEKS